ncbi:hypothetical protein HT031_001499 [Scenedesmus sp. PABB004]|nr:hypothetical protein HT031_001499 [Scenedesmus sp. PABB004]
MPKRTTLIYTSNDAPRTEGAHLFVYYCKYSGKHAFTTDVDIDTLPRRRTDNARILDTGEHALQLLTTDGGTKLLRRSDGRVERQRRLNVGSLPVAYTCDARDGLVYIMDRAVTSYDREAGARGRRRRARQRAAAAPPARRPRRRRRPTRTAAAAAAGAGDKIPVPPCIRVGESGNVEVTLELEDRQPHSAVGKISADAVRVAITGSASHEGANAEVMVLMAKCLSLRHNNLTLLRGSSKTGRVLVVEMLSTRQVYARLRGLPMPQRKGADGGPQRKGKPWHHGL